MIVQTAQSDHVLYGSANCTIAALGNDGFAGFNEEASLYRALPRDAAVERLGLTSVLQSPPLDAGALPAPAAEDPIPLADLAGKFPGRFSCLFDTLTWRLPQSVKSEGDGLELLGAEGQILSVSLRLCPPNDWTSGAIVCRAPTNVRPSPGFDIWTAARRLRA